MITFYIGKWIRGMRLDRFFKELFSGTNNAELRDLAGKAVVLVEKVKEYAASPTADMITAIIPGEWDDALKEKVKAIIPQVLEAFTKNSPCLDKPTLEEKVICLVESNTDGTSTFHNLAAAFGVALSDGKFTLSDLFLLIEPVFRLFQKHKAAVALPTGDTNEQG